jgi:hypothetical protein
MDGPECWMSTAKNRAFVLILNPASGNGARAFGVRRWSPTESPLSVGSESSNTSNPAI